MSEYICDASYIEKMNEYTSTVINRYGYSSHVAEQETLRLACSGNCVALKSYADLIFYKKILRKYNYRDAFGLYMKAAAITVDGSGEFSCTPDAYPLAFWPVANYLYAYHHETTLKYCEAINLIDNMTRSYRLVTAFELAMACLRYEDAPCAVNLIAKILVEAAGNEEIFSELKPSLVLLADTSEYAFSFPALSIPSTQSDCSELSIILFKLAADAGYIYACNSLAAREADIIASAAEDEDVSEHVERYIHYLKTSADKFESYAANRLGLFYVNGEIKGSSSNKVCFREYVNYSLAKEYFSKAIVYPDANSAWAFFNLTKYFHKDFDNNIDLMNEYMDYIKALNPAVYDEALEL